MSGINFPFKGQDTKKKNILFPQWWNHVAVGIRRTKFQNNHVNINHSRRKNKVGFIILTAIMKNVMHSV
jgi:hypothetical protein